MLRPEDCKPGALVECIMEDDGPNTLALSAIYTVKGLVPREMVVEDRFGVRLREVGQKGWAYELECFRLLPSSRLDVFRAMLKAHPAPVFKPTREIA